MELEIETQESLDPLVSIIVITYNSSKYVLETLESAKAQTYQNIELIISDDCSTDDTVDICRTWVEKNKARFVRNELITVPANTGIPANCNRGVKASKGEWIKLIAGDDALFEDSISLYTRFIHNSIDDISIIHSNSSYYADEFDELKLIKIRDLSNDLITKQNITSQIQYEVLLRDCYINTPTVFIKRVVISDAGYFDESFPLMEDWPMWLKLSKAGFKFQYLNKSTVKYRVHVNSITNKGEKEKIITKYYLINWLVYEKLILNNITSNEKLLHILLHKRALFIIKIGLNKMNFFSRRFNYCIIRPLIFIQANIKKGIFKKLKSEIDNKDLMN